MTNKEICIILNQYQYENRSDWALHIRNDSYMSLRCDTSDLILELPESAAIAICEKLVKQSSDDDIKAFVFNIVEPYKKRIEELEKELLFRESEGVEAPNGVSLDGRFKVSIIEVK